jgi:methionyl aminopeptidase
MKHDIGEIISLKDQLWLRRQKIAGNVLSNLHREIFSMMKRKSSITLNDLGKFSDEFIRHNDCTPTFYQYRGFPGCICTSLNKELVHGIPRDIVLKEGDVLKVDIGTTFEGAIADCAVTYVYGKPSEQISKLLISCQEALSEAIQSVKIGSRIGIIGKTIFEKSKKDGFGVISTYGGHGIGYNKLHDNPFVPNKSKEDEGIVIQPGLSIAIEPMFVIGNNTHTRLNSDGWTVLTKEIGAHFEHSITIDENEQLHIITEHGIDARNF